MKLGKDFRPLPPGPGEASGSVGTAKAATGDRTGRGPRGTTTWTGNHGTRATDRGLP